MTHYVFCFPYRGVGGVPVLFTRIAERLIGFGHQASVVDYPDGAMAKSVAGSRVELIVYDDAASVRMPEDAILVFQSLNPWAMYQGLDIPDTTRLFFWNCHPFNLVPVFPGLRSIMMSNPAIGRIFLATLLRRYRTIVRRFIRFLLDRGALAFMDKTNADNTRRYLSMEFASTDYLPVPAGELCERGLRPPRDWMRDGLRLAWIGRIADFKYPILKYTLEVLDRTAPILGVPMHFIVVGGGEHADDLARDIAGLRNLRVEMVGEIPVAEIQPFLNDEVDVLFGMGISALEGMRLGVPTVLLDVSYGPVPDGYVFTWMQARSGFTLGEIVSGERLHVGNDSLVQLLREVMSDYDAVSAAAWRYYGQGHAPGAVTDQFVYLTQLSSCFYKDFKNAGFSARDPIYERFARLRRRFSR